MHIISHRGYWRDPSEKNTEMAFKRSFQMGFGTETDVRDRNGVLVIAHDMASSENITLDNFLEIYGRCNLPLALNIKADGLARVLKETLARHNVANYFVFDCAVPDMRDHMQHGNRLYTRMSEVEPTPAWLTQAQGVWLDALEGQWYGVDILQSLMDQVPNVCIVSPELHQRAPDTLWPVLRPLAASSQLMLCTDLPELARTYFA